MNNALIRILLVEDNDDKAAEVLAEISNSGLCEVTRAKSSSSARSLLISTKFDLAIFDVVIPNFDGQTAPQLSNGLDLLREVHESDYIIRPRYLVGLTGHIDLVAEMREVFESLLWALLTFDLASTAWRSSLNSSIQHIRRIQEQEKTSEYGVDVCVITALKEPEFGAVLSLPWQWTPSRPLDSQTFVRNGTGGTEKFKFSVVAAHAPRMGSVPTALLVTKLISEFRPRVMIMLGICGGLRDKVELGDLVAANVSWDWQSGKHLVVDGQATFQFDPDFVGATDSLISCIDEITDAERIKIFTSNGTAVPRHIPNIKVAPMATGSAVLSDKNIIEKIILQNRKVISFDMECYGFYSSALRATFPVPQIVCIKGVSDFGDETKSDDVQNECCANSVKLMDFVLNKYGSRLLKR